MKPSKILLIDVDSKYPNIALMKLSNFFKNQGNIVELHRLGYDFFNQKKKQKRISVINGAGYDKVFISIIFTSNKNKVFIRGKCEVERGGTGWDICKKLPQEIDDCEEDYSIYGTGKGCDCSYGFITRGCTRNCSFCFVPKKEGMIHKYREISQIVKHEKARFYDNNILAFEGWKEIFQELIDKKIKCAFSQGLDIRLLTEEIAQMLRKICYISEYYFAFDDIKLMPIMEQKIKIIEKYFRPWTCRFYVYVHPDMDLKKDVMARLSFLRDHKCLAYLMRDIACLSSPNAKIYSELGSWCYKVKRFVQIQPQTFNNLLALRSQPTS